MITVKYGGLTIGDSWMGETALKVWVSDGLLRIFSAHEDIRTKDHGWSMFVSHAKQLRDYLNKVVVDE